VRPLCPHVPIDPSTRVAPDEHRHPETNMTSPERLARRSATVIAVSCGCVALAFTSLAGGQATPSSNAAPTVAPSPVVVEVTTSTEVAATVPIVAVVPLPPGGEPVPAGATTASVVNEPDPAASTTADPSVTTSLVPTSTTIPEITDLSDDDALSEAPPRIATPVLPPPKVPPRNRSLEEALKQLTERQRTLVEISQKRADLASARVATATASIAALEQREADLRSKLAELESQSSGTRAKLKARALAIFAGDDLQQIDWVLDAKNANALTRNLEFVSQSQQRDRSLLDDFDEQNDALLAAQRDLDAIRDERQIELETVLAEQSALTDALQKMQAELASISSGAAIALGGFYFPVTPPFNFADTFGAPRMTGTKYEHTHEGTDVFGAFGSPVLAVSRGVIVRMGVAKLGGNKLWLKSVDGTEYYYAHLSAFVEGTTDGSVVEAGDIIGFLGDSGNAKGTPPHVHFEVHPGGEGPVNPFPFLDAVRKSDSTALLKASIAATATTLPAAVPGQIRAGIGFVRELVIGVDSDAAGPTTTRPPGEVAVSTTLPFRPLPGSGPATGASGAVVP
jgi:murein DD-endopeptidase MepM/ murein hydrolase activator NlpD